MNIRTGDIHLTIVQGGLSNETALRVVRSEDGVPNEEASSPTPAILPAHVRVQEMLPNWEFDKAELFRMGVYLDRLESWLGRKVGSAELERMARHVSTVERQAADLASMLAGEGVVVPFPDEAPMNGVFGQYVTPSDVTWTSARDDYEAILSEKTA